MKADGTSWLPLVAAAVMIGGMFALTVSEDPEHGLYGPKLRYGLPNPKEKFFPGSPKESVQVDVQVEQIGDEFLSPFPGHDGRRGLEFIGWNAVALRPIDDSYVVKVLAYGLMDHLSGFAALHGVDSPVPPRAADEWRLVTCYPKNEEPLPLPVSRVLAMSTEEIQQGTTPMEGVHATMRIAIVDPSAPLVLGRTGLLPEAGIQEREYRVTITARATSEQPWTAFNATSGRMIAAAVLRAFFGGDGSWPVVPSDAQLLAEQGLADELSSWPYGLAKQPGDKVLDWLAPFQAPLIRGWSGEIRGQTFYKKGEDHQAIDLLRDRLLGRGGWEAVPDDNFAEALNFNRDLPRTYGRLHAQPRPFGWGIVVWEEHPRAEAIIGRWLAQAENDPENDIAQGLLRRHLFSQGLFSTTRASIEQALQPRAAVDPAIAVALEQDGSAATVAKWLRGQQSDISPEALADVPALSEVEVAETSRAWARLGDQTVAFFIRDQFDRLNVLARTRDEAPQRWGGDTAAVQTPLGRFSWPTGQQPQLVQGAQGTP
jgi:hypothetical protein